MSACSAGTHGLLKRALVEARKHRYVGKETDRRWTQGEDLSLLSFHPPEFFPSGKVVADQRLRDEINKHGLRQSMRATGFSQHTIEAIRDGKPVRRSTLTRVHAALGM